MHRAKQPIKKKQIEAILGKAKIQNEIHYLVKWTDLQPSKSTWQRAYHLENTSIKQMRKAFNLLVKDQSLPVLLEEFQEECRVLMKLTKETDNIIQPKRKIEDIIGRKKVEFKVFYLAKWQDAPIEESTWLPRYQAMRAQVLVNKFRQKIYNQGQGQNYIDQRYLEIMKKPKKNKNLLKRQKLKVKMAKKKTHHPQFNFLKKQPSVKKCGEQQMKTEQNPVKVQKYFNHSLNSSVVNQSQLVPKQNSQGLIDGQTYRRKKSSHLSKRILITSKKLNEYNKQFISSQQTQDIEKVPVVDKPDIVKSLRRFTISTSTQTTPTNRVQRIEFLRTVQAKKMFKTERLYMVTFIDGKQKELQYSELSRQYPEAFIGYLQNQLSQYDFIIE